MIGALLKKNYLNGFPLLKDMDGWSTLNIVGEGGKSASSNLYFCTTVAQALYPAVLEEGTSSTVFYALSLPLVAGLTFSSMYTQGHLNIFHQTDALPNPVLDLESQTLSNPLIPSVTHKTSHLSQWQYGALHLTLVSKSNDIASTIVAFSNKICPTAPKWVSVFIVLPLSFILGLVCSLAAIRNYKNAMKNQKKAEPENHNPEFNGSEEKQADFLSLMNAMGEGLANAFNNFYFATDIVQDSEISAKKLYNVLFYALGSLAALAAIGNIYAHKKLNHFHQHSHAAAGGSSQIASTLTLCKQGHYHPIKPKRTDAVDKNTAYEEPPLLCQPISQQHRGLKPFKKSLIDSTNLKMPKNTQETDREIQSKTTQEQPQTTLHSHALTPTQYFLLFLDWISDTFDIAGATTAMFDKSLQNLPLLDRQVILGLTFTFGAFSSVGCVRNCKDAIEKENQGYSVTPLTAPSAP